VDIIEARLNGFKSAHRHPWEHARLEVVKALVAEHVSVIEGEGTVLDIGCGDLFIIEDLARTFRHIRFIAVDSALTDSMCDEMNASLAKDGLNVHVFNHMDAPFRDLQSPVVAVLLLDVLEHIENEGSFLSELSNHSEITAKTRFLITVPAMQRLFCSHDVFLGHYRRYSRNRLLGLLQDNGFSIMQSGSFFISLLLPRFFQSMFEKICKVSPSNQGVARWQGKRWVDSLLIKALTTDFSWMRLLQKVGISAPGLSIYCIATKRTEK